MAYTKNNSFIIKNGRDFPVVCERITNETGVENYKGIWLQGDPLEDAFPVLMTQIGLLFFVSQAIYRILRHFKQPKFTCSLVAGIILGPSVLGRYETYNSIMFKYKSTSILSTVATVGVVYYIFVIAVKMDIFMIVRAAKSAWKIGLVSFLASFFAMLCLLLQYLNSLPGFEKGHLSILFFPLYSSFSNFPVIAHAMDELNMISSELGQLALSAAMVNDSIQWFVMLVGVMFRQNTPAQSVKALSSFLAFLAFSFLVIRPMILWVQRRTPEGKAVSETYTVLIILGALVMAGLCDSVGIPYVHGPLVLGFIIPVGLPIATTVVERVDILLSDFFLPIFFMHVGYKTDFGSLQFSSSFVKFELVLLVGYVAKLLGTFLISLSCKITPKNSLLLGLIMNIEGIIELVQNSRWRASKFIDDQCYIQTVLTTMVVTGTVTYFIELLYMPDSMARLQAFCSLGGRNPAIKTTSWCSELRILVCVHTPESVGRIITLLEAFNPTESSSISVFVVHLIEIMGRAEPLLLPYKKRSLLQHDHSSTDQIMRAFENYAKVSRGPVTVHPYIDIARYKSMHQSISTLARDMLIPFIIVPFHENERHLYGNRVATAVRGLNVNLQNHAPCTVGILVERGFQRRVLVDHFSLNIAVIFLGGIDDREALALASRISENSDVAITLLRITVWDNRSMASVDKMRDEKSEEIERRMDEAMVEEFKTKNLGNASVVYNEVLVNEIEEWFVAVRSLEDQNYDLYIVGKRHWGAPFVDEDKVDFVDNRELGMAGDMLASKDYRNGTATVLVMQQYGDKLQIDDSNIFSC